VVDKSLFRNILPITYLESIFYHKKRRYVPANYQGMNILQLRAKKNARFISPTNRPVPKLARPSHHSSIKAAGRSTKPRYSGTAFDLATGVESGLVTQNSMPDPTSVPPTPPQPPAPPAGPTINIGEEYGTAKKNLPPAKIVLIAVGAVLVIVLIASFLKRAKPQASGSLDNVAAVEIPDQNSTMVALTFTIRNTSEKMLYVRGLQSTLKVAAGDNTVDAVSAVDFARYFQAFPALKSGSQPALSPEDKIQPGETVARTIIVAFPVTLDAFNKRTSVSVDVWPYNETVPVVMKK